MELSIIVPVYNTDEERLYRCFQSISKIREINYECLIIDDGFKKKREIFVVSFRRIMINLNIFIKKMEV